MDYIFIVKFFRKLIQFKYSIDNKKKLIKIKKWHLKLYKVDISGAWRNDFNFVKS